MEITELIETLTELKEQYGENTDCVIGCEFGNDGRLETLSLQVEPYGDGNEVVFEENYCGEPCFMNKKEN